MMAIMETAWDTPEDSGGPTASPHGAGGLIGRGAELVYLRRCIQQEQGTPGTLVLIGDQGIGKSRLLRTACHLTAAAGGLVLTAQAWAPEREVPYGLLRHLLAPHRERISTLGEEHRSVLLAALAAQPGAAPSTTDVSSSLAALLDRLRRPGQGSATGRVLIAVDDAHASDRPTLEALGALVRRTEGARVSLLLASRDCEVLLSLPTDAEVLHVAPLSPRSSAELLDSVPGAPVGRTRLEALVEAEGNPSALLELCRRRAFSAYPVLVRERAPRLRNPGTRFDALVGALPAQTRKALVYAAAALPGDDASAVMAALGTCDLGIWTPAEEAGIVALIDGRIVFRHPLARVAAPVGQPAVLLARAHRDLAERAGARPLDRARHLVAATLGLNADSLTENLLAAAGCSTDDFTLALALEDGARISTRADERARLLAEATAAAAAVGDPDWVHNLHERFLSVNSDPLLARRAALSAATLLSHSSRQKEALNLLLDTADRHPSDDASTAARVAAVAAAITQQSGLPEHRDRLKDLLAGARGAGTAPDTELGTMTVRSDSAEPTGVLPAFAQAVATQTRLARRTAEIPEVLPRQGLDQKTRLPRLIALASVAYLSDEPDAALGHYRAAETYLRGRRAFGLRAWHVAPLLDILLATGQWPEASALLEEATDKAAVLRLTRLQADLEALALSLRALRGTASAGMSARPTVPLDLHENAATRVRVVRAGALVAMSHGDWADAFRRLRTLFAEDGAPLHPFLSSRCVADLAIAANRAGMNDDAAGVVGQVESAQGERPTARMTLLLHHASALVNHGHDPEHHFRLALVNAEGERWPLERAQARLSYAIWLRRVRRPSEARQQLIAALETAEALGARPLAAAVRHELRASGMATSPDSVGSLGSVPALDQLTAQQQQIVRMAAQGLSNREIGEQLFLSPRTVGTHLYNVYPKLGVSSRHQLRDLLAIR
jgi:DNA-binding CsgD family transcriptional regulator